MAQQDTILTNFHKASSKQHRGDSVGNQGVFNNGKQVGSIEFVPNAQTQSFDLQLHNKKGGHIKKL